MNLGLKGKNALVCGSSKGIGKAAAIEIAGLGANVTLDDLSTLVPVGAVQAAQFVRRVAG